jgi:hypothetical protein
MRRREAHEEQGGVHKGCLVHDRGPEAFTLCSSLPNSRLKRSPPSPLPARKSEIRNRTPRSLF